MKIWYAPYQLKSRTQLNRLHQSLIREGTLLRIEFADASVGYSDLFPWPELGDPTLAQALKTLQEGVVDGVEILARSFENAKLDAQARTQNRSLFAGLKIPSSHFTAINHHFDPIELRALGFSRVKVKMGRDLQSDIRWLDQLLREIPDHLLLRLDFNSGLSVTQAERFIEILGPQRLRRFDFWEDPCPFDPLAWAHLSQAVSLAADRIAGDNANAYQFRVIKPAVLEPISQAARAEQMGAKIVVTSYMDHPVGQCFAAYWAARLQDTAVICGLKTDHCYENNAFSEFISSQGPEFKAPIGAGIGFGDLLQKQDWRAL